MPFGQETDWAYSTAIKEPHPAI